MDQDEGAALHRHADVCGSRGALPLESKGLLWRFERGRGTDALGKPIRYFARQGIRSLNPKP